MNAAIFTKRHPIQGAKPGTLVIPSESPQPKIHMMSYSSNTTQEYDVENLDQLDEAFNEDSITWIDVQGFGDQSMMKKIGKRFNLHPLLLEDVVNVPQRPKTEEYGNQLLMIVRMVRVESEDEITMEQVSIVLGKSYVLTFQELYGDVLDPVRQRIRSGKGPVREHGSDYLAYAIADTIVDGYFPVLETIAEHLEGLEQEVITRPSTEMLIRLNKSKNQLVNLRRSLWPQRDAINGLVRGDYDIITPEVRIYLRDTHDHCVQTSEVVEMYREMVTGLMNTYLSSIANKTNDVMKVLTIMSSTFIPLTFLAGIYGMNFEHMPELHMKWAYPMVWIAMFLSAVGMLAFFWRKGWIGPESKPSK